MSANNLVWCMSYGGKWHVFYSGCADNTPTKPDYKDKHYGNFEYRRNALLYAHNIVNKIDEESYKEGFAGVEYGVCEITIKEEEKIAERVKRLETELIVKENAIKERLCLLEDRFICKRDHYDMDKIADHVTKGDHKTIKPENKMECPPRDDGCYQFTYCSECLAYPMGLGCPNLTKGPVQLKDEVKEGVFTDCRGGTYLAQQN